MSYIKKVKYKNELGQELVFDNHLLFCEQIDTTGTQGVFNTESLAFSDGQLTTSAFLGAKTIPCSFALKDSRNDIFLRDKISAFFNPTISGVLTVYSEWDKYEIDVRPAAVPSFQRDKDVPYVWRWDVDFIADFPYWRRGSKHTVALGFNAEKYVYNPCAVELPIEITTTVSAEAEHCVFSIAGKDYFYMKPHPEGKAVTINTRDYTVIDSDGNDVSHLISADRNLGKLRLAPGKQKVMILYAYNTTISYYHLSTGVF